MPGAGRVIAGTAAGRRLLAPGPGTRPLSDRVKQTLFAILEPDLAGANVLDLFAGSGAAGIEALSRGARRVVFVERDLGAVGVIRENLRRAGFGGDAVEVAQVEALGWLRGRATTSGPFDLAILDPPYADTALLASVLGVLGGPGPTILAPGARVVAKHFWRDAPPERMGLLASERSRRFGETALTFYRLGQGDAGAGAVGAEAEDASRGEP
jgi:16S rRNA (guanine966-N2)-methyltransferase